MSDEKVLALSSKDEIMVADKDLDLIVATAEKRVDILKKVLGAAVRRTNAKDWVNMESRPYLTASGCEKIAPLFGVKMYDLSDVRDEREDDKGKYYIYTSKATFSWAAGSIEAIGSCSSRDKFFAWDRNKQEYKVLSQVDETNIKKAAYSNLMVNGITRVLGIRNLDWKDLEAFGIKQEDAAKVEYKSGKPEASNDEKQKQQDIANMLLQLNEGDQKKAANMLMLLTEFRGKEGEMVKGINDPFRLIGKRLDITYGKAQEEYKSIFGKEYIHDSKNIKSGDTKPQGNAA